MKNRNKIMIARKKIIVPQALLLSGRALAIRMSHVEGHNYCVILASWSPRRKRAQSRNREEGLEFVNTARLSI